MFYVVSLASGFLFGLGLVVSQMINPAKVLNFLDVAGDWDPTLALVFAGAVAVGLPGYQLILRRRTEPVFATQFRVPKNNAITPSLVGGSAVFGIGWGLSGFCPGPGLAAVATMQASVIWWVIALFTGAACYRFVVARHT